MPITNKIKQLVDERGITPYRFRADLGIAQATAYSLYRHADRLPSSDVLAKICDRYMVDPSQVIEWVAPDPIEVVEEIAIDPKQELREQLAKLPRAERLELLAAIERK